MTDPYGGSGGYGGAAAGYPATFTFSPPQRVANWRPLVNWLLAIPHLIVLEVLQLVAQVLGVISWFAILFTGALPAGIADYQAMYVRYYLRTMTFVGFLREEYPSFSFVTASAEPGDDPRAGVDVVPQLAGRNRLTTFFRLILAIPHLIVLWLLSIAVWVVVLIALFAVLFTGAWPAGLRDFALGVGRWWLRVQAYVLLLTDEYPPFAFEDLSASPRPVTPGA